jgi:hypothetical protein
MPPDVVRQIPPIHHPRHVHIGENHVNVPLLLQDLYRFVSGGGLDDLEIGFFEDNSGKRPDQGLVFDQDDDTVMLIILHGRQTETVKAGSAPGNHRKAVTGCFRSFPVA